MRQIRETRSLLARIWQSESHLKKNGLWRMSASLASPAKLLGKCWRVWQISKLGYFMSKKIFLAINNLVYPRQICQIRSILANFPTRESQKFGGSQVFANLSTRQKWQVFNEYSNSLNLRASSWCLFVTVHARTHHV